MGTANSDSVSNNQILDGFFGVVDQSLNTGNYGNVTWLMNNVFCPNDSNSNPTMPGVGITDHGPNFIGSTEVTKLFNQLFLSFPNLAFHQVPNNQNGRLFSRDNRPVTIGTRAMLTGTFSNPWFPKDPTKKDKDSHYSKPLSDIPIFQNNLQSTKTAAFVVFVFASTNYPNLVSQVSIYLDRYRFMADLMPLADGSLSQLKRLEKEGKPAKRAAGAPRRRR